MAQQHTEGGMFLLREMMLGSISSPKDIDDCINRLGDPSRFVGMKSCGIGRLDLDEPTSERGQGTCRSGFLKCKKKATNLQRV